MVVTFATDYWAPALDSRARRRMTDSEGRAIQTINNNISRTSIPSTISTSPSNQNNNNSNNDNKPKRNDSLPIVNATNPTQTPFEHKLAIVFSGGPGALSTTISSSSGSNSSSSSSSSSSSASSASSLVSTPSTPYTSSSEPGSYVDSHNSNKFDNKFNEHLTNNNAIENTTTTATNNNNHDDHHTTNGTNGHIEHKKMNFVQKLFTHDSHNSPKVVISSSPVEEEFDFEKSHDSASIFKEIKEILHPKLSLDLSHSNNNHNNNNYHHNNNGVGGVMIRSDSGISGYGSDNCSKISDESLLFKKYGVCDKGCIGKGATAVVRLAHKYDNSACERIFAVKEFRRKRKNESEKDYVKKLTSEFCISSTLEHINIVRTVDFLQDENHNWCEVMEYCAGGDLYSAIKASHMTSTEINCCFKQLIMGISYLHSMGVAHRDIKPENLLLNKNGHLKITDFGVSDVFRTCWEEEIHLSKGLCGSEPYIAPEQFETKQYDARLVDIWACGIVYYCMIYQGIPFRMATPTDPNYSNYLETRNVGLYEPFERLPHGCGNLMYRILEPDVKKRIGIEKIKDDLWFKTIESCAECGTLTQEHKHIPPEYLKEIQEKDVKDSRKDKDNHDNRSDKNK